MDNELTELPLPAFDLKKYRRSHFASYLGDLIGDKPLNELEAMVAEFMHNYDTEKAQQEANERTREND